MKPYLSKLFLIATSFISATALANSDMENSEKIFNRTCAMCHGKQGERSALNQSAIINTLKTEEILTALKKRRAGEIVGAGNSVKSRLTEEEVKALAEYVPTLNK